MAGKNVVETVEFLWAKIGGGAKTSRKIVYLIATWDIAQVLTKDYK